MAGALACGSVYFGVIGTANSLSVRQTLNVLVGLSAGGTGWEIGPYFWAMHTTFIPTLFYLSVILLCWIGKLLVLPVAGVLSKGSAVDKPHHLTAGLLLLVVAVFAALGGLLAYIQEATKAAAP